MFTTKLIPNFLQVTAYELGQFSARFSGKLGARFDFDQMDLSSFDRVELAREVLQRWKSIPSLEPLAEDLDLLLFTIQQCFLEPNLKERHNSFVIAQGLLENRAELSKAEQTSKSKLDSLYESSSRVDQIRGYLTSAVWGLSWCINTWLPGVDNLEKEIEGIERNFNTGVERIIESGNVGDFFFEYETQL